MAASLLHCVAFPLLHQGFVSVCGTRRCVSSLHSSPLPGICSSCSGELHVHQEKLSSFCCRNSPFAAAAAPPLLLSGCDAVLISSTAAITSSHPAGGQQPIFADQLPLSQHECHPSCFIPQQVLVFEIPCSVCFGCKTPKCNPTTY